MEGTIPRSVAIGDAVMILSNNGDTVGYGIVKEGGALSITRESAWHVEIAVRMGSFYPVKRIWDYVSKDRLLVLDDEHAAAIRLMK